MQNQEIQKYVAYYRVSTDKQGINGLGIQSQQDIVKGYVEKSNGTIVNSFLEVASGKKINREQLTLALKDCKRQKAILIIAKLDRLARNVHFVTGLQKERIRFVAVDFPEANEFVITIMAAVAQYECKLISERTKTALKKAKLNGKILGNPYLDEKNKIKIEKSLKFAKNLQPTILGYMNQGYSYGRMAENLSNMKMPTAKGLKKWSAEQVKRVVLNLKTCAHLQ